MTRALNPVYHFEPLDRGAAPRLTRINRQCPIEADFTFYFDRGADFFAWADRCFESYHYIGIFCEDELVGYGMVGINRGQLGRELVPQVYLGDWRILPGHRGFSLGLQAAEALATLLPDEVSHGYCLVKRGNAAVEWILRTRSAAQWTVQPLCPFAAVNLLFLRRPPAVAHVRRALPAHAEVMADLMRQTWHARLFAPAIAATELAADLEQLAHDGSGGYFMAHHHGRLVGLLRAWDSHAVRRTVVLGYSRRGQIIRQLVAGARHLLPHLAPLPGANQPLRTLTLHRVAVANSNPAVLRDLLHAVLREYHGRGYHMAHLGLCGGDPLAAAVRWLPAQRFDSHIHLIARRGTDPPRVEPGLVPWIDLERI